MSGLSQAAPLVHLALSVYLFMQLSCSLDLTSYLIAQSFSAVTFLKQVRSFARESWQGGQQLIQYGCHTD